MRTAGVDLVENPSCAQLQAREEVLQEARAVAQQLSLNAANVEASLLAYGGGDESRLNCGLPSLIGGMPPHSR